MHHIKPVMRKIISLFLIVILAFASLYIPGYANNGIKVFIDDTEVSFNESSGFPIVLGGRTLVPLRAAMESFGASIEWEESTQTAIVRKDTTTVRCRIGENCIYRNNVKVLNDAAAIVQNARIYLPIRVVLEAFGATVGWDGNVVVKSTEEGSIINIVEKSPCKISDYWSVWSDALAQKDAGNYSMAIEKILSISPVFIKKNDASSNAVLYKHLGECYARLGGFSKASACFKREAYYWNMVPGMQESFIDAKRRSDLIKTGAQIYVKTTDKNMGGRIDFGENFEPKGGTMLGAYAENDTNIYNPYSPDRFYMKTFPELTGKDMAAYLLYIPYGYDISSYNSHIAEAKSKDKILQIALEPHSGLNTVNANDGYLENLAKTMQNSGCKMMIRFAGEMNDQTSGWYTADTNLYKEKFRIVADIFHKYAPSVPVIWAPNFYPAETMEDYYPGDEYVDYVGISSYKEHQPITDPMGIGIDRSRWSNQLDTIYSLYGHKKPIVVVEGGCSYVDYNTYNDITPFAASQLNDFYTYLPIKYPNVKMSFIFDSDEYVRNFLLSENQSYLDAYKKGTASDLYVTDSGEPYRYDYYELGNNVAVKAEPTELCSYIVSPLNDTAYVIYKINDVDLGTSYGIPYSVSVDFTGYKGQIVKVTVSAYNANHMQTVSYSVNVKVQ